MPTRIVIPPSPNWYLPNSCDCHAKTGILAYAASRSLVFIWPQKKDEGFPQSHVISEAHEKKITCIAWCQVDEDGLLLSTASEDGKLYIWDATKYSCIAQHDLHQDKKILSISWSSLDKRYIVSASEDSNIILTEFWGSEMLTRKLDYGKIHPTVVSLSPHNPKHLAIGCKGGVLYICDIREKNVAFIQKLRAHEDDVQSISWCPRKGGTMFAADNVNMSLLASSGRDKQLKVWAVNEGRCVAQSRVPTKTGVFRSRSVQDDKRSIWIGLNWTNENQILGSGLNGELISWTVENKMPWKIIHKLHSRPLFNISTFVMEKPMVWTSAQDRKVVLWCLEEKESKEILGIQDAEEPCFSISTIGGFVYSVNVSRIDSSYIALGLGDSSVRIWNISSTQPDFSILWNGIKGKVTFVCWHPTIEGRLAYGTDEGRVGIYDTLTTKPPLLSKTYHKGTVYNLAWAPLPGHDGLFLYSCGGQHIFIHGPSLTETEATSFNKLLGDKDKKHPSRTDLCWKPDLSLLAVGNEDGTVEIYSGSDLKLLKIIVPHKKLIQCLKWHPQYTFQSVEASQYHSWLAIASNETAIKVYRVAFDDQMELQSSLVTTLRGHKERVVCLSWNPHRDGQLLSGSYDGTAQVWDVVLDKPISNYGEHHGKVLSCEWNALEPDMAITGGDDMTLRVWNTSEQIYSTPADSIQEKLLKESKKMQSKSVRPPTLPISAKKKGKLKSLFPISATLESRSRSESLDDCKNLSRLQQIPLVHSAPEDGINQESTLVLEDENTQKKLNHLGFYISQNNTLKMLDREIEHHVNGHNFDLANHLLLWQGNLEHALKDAASRKKLDDWLVSLAPQISNEFWKEMCCLYSRQLESEGDFRKAVSYLLAAGKETEAIEMLQANNLHREAVALVRCRRSEEEVHTSLSLWATKAIGDGNLELAAKCYLATGQIPDAARVLARRSDSSSLKLSADLATYCGLDQLATAYINEAAEKESLAEQKSESTEITEESDKIEYLERNLESVQMNNTTQTEKEADE